MKYNQLALSLIIESAILSPVFAASVTLWALGSTSEDIELYSTDLPGTAIWMNPIGTGSNGEETTYLFNEKFNVFPTATDVPAEPTALTTIVETVIVSASGYKWFDPEEEAECTFSGPDSKFLNCQYEIPADVTGTSSVTVFETGYPVPYVVSVSDGSPDSSSTFDVTIGGTSKTETASDASPSSSPTSTTLVQVISPEPSRTALTLPQPTSSIGGTSSAADSSSGGNSTSPATSPSVSNGALRGADAKMAAAGMIIVGFFLGLTM